MNTTSRTMRSTEAPMDFTFTNRPSTKPIWAEEPSTPKKRPFNDITSVFGSNQPRPFTFQSPSNPQHPWAPPPDFSPTKAFPAPEIDDVDMGEATPPKKEESAGPVVLRKGFGKRVPKTPKRRVRSQEEEEESSEVESEEEGGRALTRGNTSNHYTLNIPTPPAPQSDTPYILLGYLQFFFNLSLVLLFLYLVLQFILTVQRDVEHRVSEYSMDIVQEIAMCASHYKNNLCETNPIPAMAHQCATWETCMNRDPTIVGRARVGAELIAEVVNGFVEPISWKTLIFTLLSLSFLTLFINAFLSFYRSKHHHPQLAPPPPAVTPPSLPALADHFGGYLSPAPTPAWGRDRSRNWAGVEREDMETPTRRRKIR